MRLAAGLEPPERRQGLAAHDFAQGLGNAEVIIAYSERVGASPASPSRLVQRLFGVSLALDFGLERVDLLGDRFESCVGAR